MTRKPSIHLSKRQASRSHRSGISAMWVLVTLPVLLVLFCTLLNVANLWLARAELETALESAALAAVKEWGDANGVGGTSAPRDAGQAYAALNSVRGQSLVISTNLDLAPAVNNPNANLTCAVGMAPPTGNLIFGTIDDSNPMFPDTFNAGLEPDCNDPNPRPFVVRAQAKIEIVPLCGSLFNIPALCVSAKATAVYDCQAPHGPRLIRVDQFICPGP